MHRGCSVHRGGGGEYHEYIDQWLFSTSGDIIICVGDIMSTLEDVQYIRVFNIN